jgi:hypothetical protein
MRSWRKTLLCLRPVRNVQIVLILVGRAEDIARAPWVIRMKKPKPSFKSSPTRDLSAKGEKELSGSWERRLSGKTYGTRRGWLKNGNKPGDPQAALRCGAKTRRGSACQAPAMRNGRCWMHGGKSTGPRTAEGLERCRTANLKHGRYSKKAVARESESANKPSNTCYYSFRARRGLHVVVP